MPTISPKLTSEQLVAIDRLLEFPKPVQTLGGYAGTGKTTAIKTLAKHLPTFAVCAFTGKAAHVLRKKGVRATTIHMRIYKAMEVERTDGKGNRRFGVDFDFELRTADEINCEGFIVDEASMVNKQIHGDLLSFDVPLIFVGDHGQLEPVGGDKFNLMEKPDLTLERVHRNAGEIAHFADFIRKGNDPANWGRSSLCTGERVRLRRSHDLNDVEDPDQIIVAFNKTRIEFNKVAREYIGYPPDRPVVGDRVMCLRNEHWIKVYNGIQGEIVELDLENERMVFRSDGVNYPVKFLREQFNSIRNTSEYRDFNQKGKLPFDYAYAVTCHKAQGDEWDHVLVFEQRCRAWTHARWA